MSKLHIAVLESVRKFPRFQRQTNQGGEGVDFLFGVPLDKPPVLQSILFNAEMFTSEQARKWLATHRVGDTFTFSTEAAVLGGLNFDQVEELVQRAIDEQYPALSQGSEPPYENTHRFRVSRLWEDKALAQRCYWSDPNDPAYFLFPYSIETDIR